MRIDRSMDPTPPPLKRKRESEAGVSTTTSVSLKDAVRDDKFYLPDTEGADCVLLAGDTLFRVGATEAGLYI